MKKSSGKLCSKTLVEQAHRRGMHVSTWTVNRIHDMLQLEEMGVDSIITDYPTSTRMFFDNRARSALSLPQSHEGVSANQEAMSAG